MRQTATAVVSLLASVLLFGLFWFGNLEYRDLVDPDEGRYAEIPREMLARGETDLEYFADRYEGRTP